MSPSLVLPGHAHFHRIALPATNARTRNTRKMTMAMKNKMRAIPAVAAEMPVNPNNPAINDITKKNNAHFSMIAVLSILNANCWH
jgi:hypothetical protein